MPRRVRLILAAAALVVAGAGPGPASAQQAVDLSLVRVAAISPWIDAQTPFTATLQISNPTELTLQDASIRVAMHARVLNRSQLRLALDGRQQTDVIGSFTVPVDPVAAGESQTVTLTREAQQIAPIRGTGVYPISIAFAHSRGSQQLFSAIPHFVAAPAAPINVAWILPIDRPDVAGPDGVYPEGSVEALQLEEIAQQIEAIAAQPGAPVTLAFGPSLLDTVEDLADGYVGATRQGPQAFGETSPGAQSAQRLKTATAKLSQQVELATVPYAPADLVTLHRRGMTSELVRQLAMGREVIQQRLGRPASGVLVPPGLVVDAPTLLAASTLGLSGVVLDPGVLQRQPITPFEPSLFGPSRPIQIQDARPTALLPDLALRDRLNTSEQGVLLAQAVIAETASAWLELPVLAPERVLVLAGAAPPAPPALAAALRGISRAPWVKLVSATDALLSPMGDPLPTQRLQRADTPYLAAARRARRALATAQSIAVDPLPGAERLDRMVLRAQSASWATDPERGTALARSVESSARAITGALGVAERRVTLTSKTGSVPVTILNGATSAPDVVLPLRVRIRIASSKLVFPEGSVREVELNARAMTLDFPVRALTAGTFPLDVFVETANGQTRLASGKLVLRSSAVSTVTLAAVGGSTLFLLVAYVRRARRRENRARARAAHPAGSARKSIEPPA